MQPYTKHTWKLGEVITPQKLNEISDALEAFTTQIHNATSGMSDLGENDFNKLNRRFEMLAAQIQWNTLDDIRDIVRDFTQKAVSYAENQTLEPAQQALARSNIGAAAASEVVTYRDQINNTPYSDDLVLNVKQENARRNIDAVGTTEFQNAIAGMVKYTDQTSQPWLIDSVQAIARNNIGAVSEAQAGQIADGKVATATATINSRITTEVNTLNDQINTKIAEADVVTNISSDVGNLTVVKGLGNNMTTSTIPIVSSLPFNGGIIAQDDSIQNGPMMLYLTQNGTPISGKIYDPIDLSDLIGSGGGGGGLAFNGGYCNLDEIPVVDSQGQETTEEVWRLHLTFNNVELPLDVYTPIIIKGGGGSGGNYGGAGLDILQRSKFPNTGITNIEPAECSVKVRPRTAEVDVDVKWYVNGTWLRYADASYSYDSNGIVISYDVQRYLSVGKNTIIAELTGTDSSTYIARWSVQVYKFEIKWNSLPAVVEYTNQSIDYELPIIVTAPEGTYNLVANGIYGNTVYQVNSNNFSKISVSDLNTRLIIPRTYLNNRPGKHLISVKLVNVNNLDQESKQIKIVILNEVSQRPAVVVLTDTNEIEQYQTAIIKYYIHDAEVDEASVNISLTYINEEAETLDAQLNQTETRKTGQVHTFTYPFYSYHLNGVLIRITYNKSSSQILYDEVTLFVKRNQDNINLSYQSSDIKYIFDPRGWTNNASNKNDFAKDGNKKITYSSNFDWINGGFQQDTKSINNTIISDGSAFVIKRGTSITLPRGLFNDNDDNGKTICISFKVKNSANYDAKFLESVTDDKGLRLYANQAELYLNTTDKPEKIPYAEENRIDLAINVQPSRYTVILDSGQQSTQVNKYRVATIWLNGVPSTVVKYEVDDLLVTSNGTTIIGSNDCDIYIYNIKIYDKSLDFLQMNQNFIADGTTMDEKLERYNRNSYLYNDGVISESEIKNKHNLTVIHIATNAMTRNKKDSKTCNITITEPDGSTTTMSQANFKVQGTTSSAYERSSLNLDIDFSNCKDADNNSIFYQISESSIPVNYLNIKVNVASSENANNVCAVDWYNKYQPFLSQAKAASLDSEGNYKAGKAIRDSVEAKPCVIFIENLNTDPREGIYVGSQYVAPGSTVFYAVGDLCNSKKNLAVFGQDPSLLENITHPTLGCMEVGGNSLIPQQFLMTSSIYDTLMIKDTVFNKKELKADKKATKGWYVNDGTNDPYYPYEWRMKPANNAYDGISADNIADFWLEAAQWVASLTNGQLVKTKKDAETNAIVQQWGANDVVNSNDVSDVTHYTYSYDYKLISYKFIEKEQNQTDNDFQNRINNLKTQFYNYFQLDSLLYHFLMIEFFAAIDNVSKNTFYSLDFDNKQFYLPGHPESGKKDPTLDSMKGYRWNIKAAYDWDTILGSDNDGKPFTSFGIDYEQTYGTNNSYYFNAGRNPLWHFIRTVFKTQLYSLYGKLNDTAFDAGAIKKKWDNYQLQRPEILLSQDAYVKYILPYKTEGFRYANANEDQHSDSSYLARLCGTKKYQRDQFLSYQKYYMDGKYGTTTKTGSLNFRTDASSLNVILSPYITTYVTIIKDNQPIFSEKLIKNEQVRRNFSWIATGSDDYLYVQPAGLIQRIDPLSKINIRTFSASSANKLLRYDMHEETINEPGNSNTRWGQESNSSVAVSSHILEYFNVKNVSGYTEILNFETKNGDNLKYLNIVGTGCDEVHTVPYCPIEKLYLNDCSRLYLQNNSKIKVLSFSPIRAARNGIRQLFIKDCSQAATNTKLADSITSDDQTENTLNLAEYLMESLKKSLSGQERYISINNINWTLQDTSLLHDLYNQKGFNTSNVKDNDSNSYLAGTVYIHTEDNDVDIYDEEDKRGKLTTVEFEKFKQRWPELTIIPDYQIKMFKVRLKHSITGEILVEKQMQSGITLTPALFTSWLDQAGYYPTYNTNTTVNTFKNYQDFTDSLILGEQDMTFITNYEVSERKYEVIWYEDNTRTIELARTQASYGDDLNFLEITANKDPITNEIIALGVLPTPRFSNNTWYLFDGWDNSSGYITESPTIICGKWISSPATFTRLNDGFSINGQYVSFNKLNAANLYALMQMTPSQREALLGNQSQQLTSVVDITLGHDYNYTSIPSSIWLDELLQLSESDQPIKLNGTNQLISLEQSFNLLIECNSSNTVSGRTLFSLVDDTEKYTMLSVRKTSNSNSYSHTFQLYVAPNGNSPSNLVNQSTYNTDMSNNANKRFIISNNPSLHKLVMYWWDSGESIETTVPQPIEIIWQNWQNKKFTLVLGNEYKTDLYNTWLFNTAQIKFTYIKYWNQLLGPSENKNLALSSTMTLPFRYSGYKVHGLLQGTRYTYKTGFSFAQSAYTSFSGYYYSRNFLTTYLPKSSSYFEKIFPQSWRSIFVPINDYYWSTTLASSTPKSNLKIYPPMYSQQDEYYYPEYRDYYIYNAQSLYDRTNAAVQSTYGIPFDKSILLTSSEDHTINQTVVNKYNITTGTCVGCQYNNDHRVIFCSAQDFSKLDSTFANKFVPATQRSIGGMSISGTLTDLYVASAYDIYQILQGGLNQSGKTNVALVYLSKRQATNSSLYYGYEGGAINAIQDTSNTWMYFYPICCFSIGEISVTYDENGNEVE